MYPINNPYAFQEDGLTQLYLIINNGETLTESNLIQNSFQIDRYATSSIAPDIGNVVAAELTFAIDKDTTDIQISRGDYIECTLVKGSTTIGAGHFIVISVRNNLESYEVVCLDKMVLLDSIADLSDINFPIKANAFLTQICNSFDIQLHIDSGYNANLYEPELVTGTTYRNVLSSVCELMGANAYMDWNGELRIGWYTSQVAELGSDKRTTSQIGSVPYTISNVSIVDEATATVEIKESNILLFISNNPFLAKATQTQKDQIQTQLRNRLNGTIFYGANATVLPMPVLYPMDKIAWGDGKIVPITRVTFGLNTNTRIEAQIEDRDNNYNFGVERRITDRTIEFANKYTDSAVQGIRTYVDGEVDILEGQIDQKIETFYQSTDPSLGWASGDWSKHEGDLWHDTSLDSSNRPKNETKRWNGTEWVLQNVPTEVFDEIDGKAQIFISQPKPPYAEGDLWFNSATSDIMTCINSRAIGSYTASDWQKRNRYTEDLDFRNSHTWNSTETIATFQAKVYKDENDITGNYPNQWFTWWLRNEDNVDEKQIAIGKSCQVRASGLGYGSTIIGVFTTYDSFLLTAKNGDYLTTKNGTRLFGYQEN